MTNDKLSKLRTWREEGQALEPDWVYDLAESAATILPQLTHWRASESAPPPPGVACLVSDGTLVRVATWTLQTDKYWKQINDETRVLVSEDASYWDSDGGDWIDGIFWAPLPSPPQCSEQIVVWPNE